MCPLCGAMAPSTRRSRSEWRTSSPSKTFAWNKDNYSPDAAFFQCLPLTKSGEDRWRPLTTQADYASREDLGRIESELRVLNSIKYFSSGGGEGQHHWKHSHSQKNFKKRIVQTQTATANKIRTPANISTVLLWERSKTK
jgi:hypothetical protein